MLLLDVVWCNYTLFYQRRSNAFWCLTSFTSSWRGYVLLVSLGSPFEGQSGWPQLGRRWRSIQLSSTWPVDLKDYGLAIVFLVRSGPLSFSAYSWSKLEALAVTAHGRRSLEFGHNAVLLQQGKFIVYRGLYLRRSMSSLTPHRWGHQSLQRHTWHLDGLWRCFIRWCLLYDLIVHCLPMLHRHLFHIPRSTCPPAPSQAHVFYKLWLCSDVVNQRSRLQEPQLLVIHYIRTFSLLPLRSLVLFRRRVGHFF